MIETLNINEVQSYSDSSNNNNYVQVTNNGQFTARFIITYVYNGTQVTANSENLAPCSVKKINIPSSANNVTTVVQVNDSTNWVPIYNNVAANGLDKLNLVLSGTIQAPLCTVIPNVPDVGDSPNPTMAVVQTVNPTAATVGQCITVTVAVTNHEGVTANGVNLQVQAPAESTFIPGSLMIAGVQSNLSEFPTGGITLGNIQEEATVTVVYQVLYNSVPQQANGPLLTAPQITYSFTGSNGSNQAGTLTGTTGTLTVTSGCQPPTCNPCCCCCCCCCPSTSSMYNSYNQCM
ncbi:DUF11 domain-containing protein [Clostridium botulinum]|uniref:DUF11 domain-containing protein n=1 Tax=Clostridium botulinum TaxID=1491 RepID=A0A9Q1ZBN4_CLOBO|nr:DUF11 domain-containing protein [Clostridium botulinum]AEB75590.1 repeat domain protein [Clostridium botulinum BKT015925]KEH99551.1 hypothetical protein Z953_11195 [Clostridium botulinum D str. 16868]KEI04318.1 hypothetical protein Y848_02145 [Clostridium botulinum C/D str. Sp77]KLU75270.1 hypothetical protein CBC3_09770 [Clostridium botulinum V891]KOA76582.1 hypothetical protein ADU77_08945 [Clostridium botulinum]